MTKSENLGSQIKALIERAEVPNTIAEQISTCVYLADSAEDPVWRDHWLLHAQLFETHGVNFVFHDGKLRVLH